MADEQWISTFRLEGLPSETPFDYLTDMSQ